MHQRERERDWIERLGATADRHDSLTESSSGPTTTRASTVTPESILMGRCSPVESHTRPTTTVTRGSLACREHRGRAEAGAEAATAEAEAEKVEAGAEVEAVEGRGLEVREVSTESGMVCTDVSMYMHSSRPLG